MKGRSGPGEIGAVRPFIPPGFFAIDSPSGGSL